MQVPNKPGQWLYSFPAEGEGVYWKQGLARRVSSPSLTNAWREAAGGCAECGQELEDGCVGKCLQQKLTATQLLSVFNAVAADMTKYPNYGIPNAGTLKLAATAEYCVDLSGGDTSNETPVQVCKCSPSPGPDSKPQPQTPTPIRTFMHVFKCNGLIQPALEMLSALFSPVKNLRYGSVTASSTSSGNGPTIPLHWRGATNPASASTFQAAMCRTAPSCGCGIVQARTTKGGATTAAWFATLPTHRIVSTSQAVRRQKVPHFGSGSAVVGQ